MKTIKSTWEEYMKGGVLPTNLRSLETIMNRYGCDDVILSLTHKRHRLFKSIFP